MSGLTGIFGNAAASAASTPSSSGSTSNSSSTSQSAQSQAQLQGQLNQFLTLLTTQLKNQDPLNPMDSTQFTSQLVQFASVEQQIYQNANLEKILKAQQSTQTSSLINYIGTTVEVTGKKVPLENGNASFTYTMPSNAKQASITITDQSGNTVFQQDADLTQGKHTFNWDGKDKNGNQLADGTYNVLVSGTDYSGKLLDISQTVFGKVTGASVNSSDGSTQLTLGNDITANYSDVLSVKETPSSSSSTSG